MSAANPYTREYLIEHIDRLVLEAAELTAQWLARDREDPREVKRIAGRLCNVHRAMSAHLHEVGQIDYRELMRTTGGSR